MPGGKTGLGWSPLPSLASESVQKFDTKTFSFSIIFQFQVLLLEISVARSAR